MRKVLYMLGQLTDEHIEWMIAEGNKLHAPAGTVLIEEGKPSDMLYIVLDGTLGIYVNVDGANRMIARRGAGEILGEMSFIDDRPPTATVRTEEDSVLYALPKTAVAAKLETDRDFAARFYRGIAISLSYRLRESMEMAAPGGGVSSGGEVAEDEELDADTLDNAYLAGLRFDRIVRRMLDAT